MLRLSRFGARARICARLVLGMVTVMIVACEGEREQKATLAALPWHAAVGDTSADLRDAIQALSDTGVISTARLRIGATDFLFARMRTGSGTGWRQSEFRVISSGEVVWRLLADESAAASASPPPGPYLVHGCLFVRDDSLLAYYVASKGVAGQQVIRDDSTPRFGHYRWAPAKRAFQYALPADSDLQNLCERELSTQR